MAHVLGPNQCRRGEQLGLKIYLHNFDSNRMFVTVTLLNSEDYKFVHVGADGIVASYSARLSGGDHERLIYVRVSSSALSPLRLLPPPHFLIRRFSW